MGVNSLLLEGVIEQEPIPTRDDYLFWVEHDNASILCRAKGAHSAFLRSLWDGRPMYIRLVGSIVANPDRERVHTYVQVSHLELNHTAILANKTWGSIQEMGKAFHWSSVGQNADWAFETWCISQEKQKWRYGYLLQDSEDGNVQLVWAPHTDGVDPWQEDYFEKHHQILWTGPLAALTKAKIDERIKSHREQKENTGQDRESYSDDQDRESYKA